MLEHQVADGLRLAAIRSASATIVYTVLYQLELDSQPRVFGPGRGKRHQPTAVERAIRVGNEAFVSASVMPPKWYRSQAAALCPIKDALPVRLRFPIVLRIVFVFRNPKETSRR